MWLYAACWVTCSVGLLIFKHVFQSIDSRVHFKAALFSWSLSYQVDTPGARAFSAVRSSATTSWQNCRAVRCLLGAVRAWYIIGVIFMSVGLIFSTAALCVASTVQVARLLEWMAAQVHETAPTAPVPLADAEPAWFAPVIPGVNSPTSELGLMWSAIVLAVFIHELGHFVAARLFHHHVLSVGAFLSCFMPGAFVEIGAFDSAAASLAHSDNGVAPFMSDDAPAGEENSSEEPPPALISPSRILLVSGGSGGGSDGARLGHRRRPHLSEQPPESLQEKQPPQVSISIPPRAVPAYTGGFLQCPAFCYWVIASGGVWHNVICALFFAALLSAPDRLIPSHVGVLVRVGATGDAHSRLANDGAVGFGSAVVTSVQPDSGWDRFVPVGAEFTHINQHRIRSAADAARLATTIRDDDSAAKGFCLTAALVDAQRSLHGTACCGGESEQSAVHPSQQSHEVVLQCVQSQVQNHSTMVAMAVCMHLKSHVSYATPRCRLPVLSASGALSAPSSTSSASCAVRDAVCVGLPAQSDTGAVSAWESVLILTHTAPANATRDESLTSSPSAATTILLGPPSHLFRALAFSDWQLSAGASCVLPRSIAELALRAPRTLDRFARYMAAVNLSLALLNSAPLFLLDGAVAVRPLVAMFACLLACACAWAKQALARRRSSDSRGGSPNAAPDGSPMRGIVVVGSSSYSSTSSSSLSVSASATAASANVAHASAANAVHRSLIELLENPLKRIARDAIVSQHAASIERLPRAARYHALWLGMCSDERVRSVSHRVLQAGSLMAALHVGAATAAAVL